jgi:hypothetical protein
MLATFLNPSLPYIGSVTAYLSVVSVGEMIPVTGTDPVILAIYIFLFFYETFSEIESII